jgi:NADPH:quinone reductase
METLNQIQIDVKAFGINRLDLEMKKRTDNLGVEVSGIVTSSTSSLFSKGDKVCSLVKEGGYGKEVYSSESTTFILPGHLSFEEGAALPESLFTVALNVFELAQLKRGERLFVHSATGGVGNLAIALAMAYGCEVEASSSRNTDILRQWGASKVYSSSQELEAETFDVLLDNSGAGNFALHLKALRNYGRLSLIDAFTGESCDIDLGAVLDKSLQITGSLLRPRTNQQKAKTKAIIESILLPLLAAEKIHPHIHQVFKSEAIPTAHKILEERSHIGKLIGVHL